MCLGLAGKSTGWEHRTELKPSKVLRISISEGRQCWVGEESVSPSKQVFSFSHVTQAPVKFPRKWKLRSHSV